MLIIADTSALITIATCNGLRWLEYLFENLLIPRAVFLEATEENKPQSVRLKRYLLDKVVDINLQDFLITFPIGLGQGELEAMALYKREHADRLLIDDLRARKTASYNGINIIGSMGVLLLAKKKGLIPAVKPYIELIQRSEIHLGQPLMTEVLKVADEI
jgi:hypothetical protein